MSDGQDKSDDLIAELAKLMASSAQGADTEAKPAPKLVTLPDAVAPEAPPVRVPGVGAAAPPPAAPIAASPDKPQPIPAGILRIPGMDQPLPVQPVGSATDAPAAPAEAKPAASFDFGTLPAASTSFRPEPLSNWQDREIPKPVPSRPAPVDQAPAAVPELDAGIEAEIVSAPIDDLHIVAPRPVGPMPAAVGVTAPLAAAPMIAAAKASPAGDSFDFDFGFASQPPAPIAPAEPKPQGRAASAAAPSVAPAPSGSSADPIADLIAAELDAVAAPADDVEHLPPVLPPKAAQPAPRNYPLPDAAAARPAAASSFRATTATTTAPRTEDRFGMAPVFGPAKGAPATSSGADPMDEIESLIGEAVRVELTAEKPSASAPPQGAAPVVPPLTTGFAPRRAAIKDTEPQVPSAEAAILAAAAASGAEVGHVDGLVAEPSPYKRPKAKPERRSLMSGGMRQYVGMAVAGTLLLAAGFGLYWVLGMGRGSDADAPVLQADATPIKETPPPTQTAANQQGSVVFGELDGTENPADEQLVSRDDSAETSVADVARTVGTEDTNESELANRKVRTVTVRPDGTIVSGDDAVAGNEALPVDRPIVPDLPGADVQPSQLLAAVPNPGATADPIAAAINNPDATAVDSTQVAAISAAPATEVATIDPTIVAPLPLGRPADRSVLGGGANQQQLATVEEAGGALAAAPVAPARTGGAYVQLSSQPTEGDAQASLRTTQNRLSNLLNGRSLAIRQVDLGAKGTWYRVVLPVDSFQQAAQTCASLKASGVDCVAING